MFETSFYKYFLKCSDRYISWHISTFRKLALYDVTGINFLELYGVTVLTRDIGAWDMGVCNGHGNLLTLMFNKKDLKQRNCYPINKASIMGITDKY